MKYKISRSEYLLVFASTIITLLAALLLIRWLAPTLLGLPSDLVLVKSSREAVAYYDAVFPVTDPDPDTLSVPDPVVLTRAHPMQADLGGFGPHDVLGFRNGLVPGSADVIIIGDSQTYGNNAFMWENWPHRLQSLLPAGTSVYSMAAGGWGAVQYSYMFTKALRLHPRVIIIAFYTGNDALETATLALARDAWRGYLDEQGVGDLAVPAIRFPPPTDENWEVNFRDGVRTVFTPELRRLSNMPHPAVDLGYGIMGDIAADLAGVASTAGIELVFTIIPTKEYVYARKIAAEGIPATAPYTDLIRDESQRIGQLADKLRSLDHAHYVSLTGVLQDAATGAVPLYPEGINGHPVAVGYRLIAEVLAGPVRELLPAAPGGLMQSVTSNGQILPVYVRQGHFWLVEGDDRMMENVVGASDLPRLDTRRLTGMVFMGYRNIADLIASEQPVMQ